MCYKLFTKLTLAVAMIMAALGLNSCEDFEKHNILGINMLNFTAENISLDSDRPVKATSATSENSTSTVTVTIVVNGESHTSTIINDNRLPVMPGNVVEVCFRPTCEEHTEATFTMPDGTILKATAMNPTVQWVVPDNVADGMQIIGASQYEKGKESYKISGSITLKLIK